MKIIFAGTPDFAIPTLQMLIDVKHEICAVYTQPDRPSGRGRTLKPSPIKALALKAGLTIIQVENFKTADSLKTLQNFKADVMIVVAYGLILPQTVLDAPKKGCLNIHGSLLPRWRGAAPIHRALMAGDTETGVTIMQVIKKLDAGDMLHKEYCPISEKDTSNDLHDKLAKLGAIGLKKVLSQLENTPLTPEVQNETLVTYAEKLQKSESQLDWTQTATVLDRQIRGLNPWPVAQTLYQGKNFRIWRASIEKNSPKKLAIATVFSDGKTLLVGTGDGILSLQEVQLPGGKRLPIHAFLNAHNVNGIQLGS
ncbi:MAG: methionyl-tRNA formyltransferase [Methylococcales bacterium]|nr:methionyl-tRNA formyltransferase [Methylococcales bacterium]